MDDGTVSDWLNELAAKKPTPGGGAVAALTAALAAAQLEMVAIYTTGDKWADRQESMLELVQDLQEARQQALSLVDADAAAFQAVGSAYKLPKDTEDEKNARFVAIQNALIVAAKPPAETALIAERLVPAAELLGRQGNPNVISDVAVGAALIKSALESAIVNIEINKREIKDNAIKTELGQAITAAEAVVGRVEGVIKTVRGSLQQL